MPKILPIITMAGLSAGLIFLTGCGATTGTVAKSIAASTATSAVNQSLQKSTDTTPAPAPAAMVATDGEMSCEQITTEMASLDQTIAEASEIAGTEGQRNVADSAVNAGASYALAKTGASGALNKVPFGNMFAKNALKSQAKAKAKKIEAAKADIQNAQMRRSSLQGLYTGKSCT